MLTLAVPMSVLVATLMAFGTMSSNNEITIMKASGISLPKLMAPIIGISIIVTYLMVLFNNDVLPEANHSARILMQDISRTKPTFFLQSGKFSDDIGNAKIFVRKTFENSNELEGIYVYDFNNPNVRNLVTAEKGDISFTSDFKNIVLNLRKGEIHQLNNLDYSEKYRRVEFEKHRIILDAAGFGFDRSSDNAFIRGDRELSADAMRTIIDSISINKKRNIAFQIERLNIDLKKLTSIKYKDTSYIPLETQINQNTNQEKTVNQSDVKKVNVEKKDITSPQVKGSSNVTDTLYTLYKTIITKNDQYKNQKVSDQQFDKQIDIYLVEIYKKYSIPFACLIFTLIGAPLGYKVRRGGFGIASGLSLLFFLVYWASLIGGEKLADRDIVSPFWGMWLVNIVLGLFGLYLMFKSS